MKRDVKTKETKKESRNIFFIVLRYLILLALMFSLPIFYFILTPLTIYPLFFLFKILFSKTVLSNTAIAINGTAVIVQIIPACVAGSAYLLLLILNLLTPMNNKKRLYSITFSFIIFYILNLIRIFILILIYYYNSAIFDFTHKLFWYVFSIIFVVGIWFYTTYKFKIKDIPIYTDIKSLYK